MLDAAAVSARRVRRSRIWSIALAVLAAAALLAFVLLAYELALTRIPQHRAALERLVRAQTGFDIRFSELRLRWGWYGPEAVFRSVEMAEPGSTAVVLRAPELVVGFDAWRTLRSGYPEAGRIELIAPDIDLVGAKRETRRAAAGIAETRTAAVSTTNRAAMLERWRGGRVDIEGGTLRLPDPGGSATPFTLQIRRASVRRAEDEWSAYALVFLPDRVGRTARVVLRVNGDLSMPERLSGSLRLEARRVLLGGCRDILAAFPQARYLPRAGGGDLSLDLDFEQGQLLKADGSVRASGVVFDPIAVAGAAELNLERLRGAWHMAHHGSGWRLSVDSLQLARGDSPAALTVDMGEAGSWFRAAVDSAPAESVLTVARWLGPHLDLAGIDLTGAARNVRLDWDAARSAGERLQLTASFADLTLVPQSHDFTLSGLAAQVVGHENRVLVDLSSRAARLELAASRQYPLEQVHVESRLRINNTDSGWTLTTDEFLLERQRARLALSGSVHGSATEPTAINARGTLFGVDVPLVERLLGEDAAAAFGAVASRLTAGHIRNAEFELHGPVAALPFGGHDGFTGSLAVQDATVSGGGLWPDATDITARIEWRGPRIQATIESGHAGAFQLASGRAQWDASGRSPTRLTGHVSGRLEDAIAWVSKHQQLQQYAPGFADVDARGDAEFDFNLSIPVRSTSLAGEGAGSPASGARGAVPEDLPVQARVTTFVDGVQLRPLAGLPPVEALTGFVVIDSGRLAHSTLTGRWLGGPVTLRLSEHHEKGARVLAVQAAGAANAQQLAAQVNLTGAVEGDTDWLGELAYFPGHEAQPGHWRLRADSSLVGVISSLPEPLAKRPVIALPTHLELTGGDEAAQMQVALGDRVHGVLALRRQPSLGWTVERGAVRFGGGGVALPNERVLVIRGRLGRLDLPVYALAWQRLREDTLPTIRADIVAGELAVGSRTYADVSLHAERSTSGNTLQIASSGVQGTARWGAPDPGSTGARAPSADVQLARLELPEGNLPTEGLGLIAALAPTAHISIDELIWRAHAVGRLTASFGTHDGLAAIDDIRLVSDAHEARGAVQCETRTLACQLTFRITSQDAQRTLEEFGFRRDLTAREASLSGELQWSIRPEQSWLAGLRGTVNMDLADGSIPRVARFDEHEAAAGPFALLSVPALVSTLDEPNAAGAALADAQELHFNRLRALFTLLDGEARTSNLHFDGDAEILMRGRTGLVARDYDEQVWVLRGGDRLPAAIRQFGATPRVAAAWLSLRDLVAGHDNEDRARALLRLQGSWDDPMVVAAR